MKILKNSEKFSVLKKRVGKKISIIKIANKDYKKINEEIELIKKLKKSNNFFKNRIPKIISKGVFSKGFYQGKGYYEQVFIQGKTLSQVLQDKKSKKKYLNNIKKILMKELTFSVISNDKKTLSKNQHIKDLIKNEFNKIKKNIFYKNLFYSKKLVINNNEYKNIEYYLKRINSLKIIKKSFFQKNFISKIGHWNYHGGNIIFPRGNISNFKIIDPDAKWKNNDPFFSLARYFYTFTHDTMEYDKYIISTKISKNSAPKYFIKLIWAKKIVKNYETIFSNIFCSYFSNKHLIKNLCFNYFIRLNMCLCLCLLRGVNANHQNEIFYSSKTNNNFQNKGIFLFLITVIFLKNFTNYLTKNV